MESGSPGNETVSKPLIHSNGIWSSSDSSLRTNVAEGHDSTNNSQFLFIAVEYVNDGNVDYGNINTAASNFPPNQEFSELSDQLNPLDSSLNSQNDYSFINNESHLSNSTNFNQNSIVILPNNSEQQNGFSLNAVDGNMDLLRQVVTNRLCQQIENSIDLKQESDSVELLIANQNTGLSYSINSDTTNITKQNDIMLNNLDTNNGDDRILDSQGLVLDSNHLISLDEHVLMDNGTLVLKSDLNSELNNVVQHINLNHLETNISQTIDENYKTIEDSYMEEHSIETNEVVPNVSTEKTTNFEQPIKLKIEENDYVKNEEDAAEETQARRSKRLQFDDDDDSDLFTDCQDCIMGSSLLVMCDRHRMLSISDKPVPSRARATLPGVYLSINKVGTDEKGEPIFGVFSRKFLPKRTQFGPIEGVLSKCSTTDVQSYNNIELILENESGEMHKMDTSNEDLSNWMRFVRKAEKFKDQNLILNQMGPSLYYISTCNIHPRQELMVGYSAVYAEKRGLNVLTNEPNEEDWPCFECDSMFVSFDELDKHLNSVHGSENSAEKRLSRMKRSKKKRSELNLKNLKKVSSEKSWAWEDISSKTVQKFDLDNNGIVSSTEKDPLSEKENEEKIFYTCKVCKKVFELGILLEIHCYLHNSSTNKGVVDSSVTSSSDEQHICPECDVIFSSMSNLAYHVNDHQVRTAKAKFKCNICYKSFASKERVQRHMLVHAPQKLKPLQCNMCPKRFLNNSALTCHIKAHSKITFECPICKEVVDHVLSHKEHVRSHCLNGVYSCPHCKKEFKEYSVIRKHIRAFHCDRKHACLYCNKLFPTTDKLRMHLLKHSDHREFLCAECGKQFKRKDKLKEHTKRMHSDKEKNDTQVMVLMDNKQDEANHASSKRFMPKVSPTDYHRFIYKCHTCMVGFKRRGMLVNHLAKRHPDVPPDSVPELSLPILRATRDYYCQYCEKVYKSSSKRKAHILKNHPGLELPLSRCKDAADISGMLNPTFSQTVGSVTTNPHNCLWCHKQYASKAKLLQHQRNKHSDLMNNEPKVNTRISTSEDVPDPILTGKTVGSSAGMESNQINVIENENNKNLETEIKNSTDEIPSEFLNTDGFDTTGILMNSKDKIDEQFSREMLTEAGNNIHGELRISQNGQCYRLVPVSNDQDSVIPVGDSVLRALLTTTTPVMNRGWSDSTPFTSYIPPR